MASPWERAKAKESYKDLKSSMPQGQAGGIGSTSSSSRKDYYQDPVERMRGKYFDNREDISRDRLERRLAQQQEYDLFKLTQMKPVSGASNLYQSRTPGGTTLADKAQELAMKYGPTPSEIAGDIGYGASKMLQAYGIPFASTALKIGSAVSDAWNKVRGFFSPSQTPQGIETQFPRVSPKARGYFGGYNQGIDTQIPVANDRGMNIPVSIAQPVASTPLNTGFIPEGYGGITSIPLSSGYLPEGYSYGIGSVPDYYDSNNTLGNIYLNSQGYNVPVSNNLMSSRNPSYLEQQDNYYYQNRPKSSPTGDQYYYADASKKDIKTIAPFRDAGMSYGDVMNNFGSVIDNLRQKNPSLSDDDIKGILDGTITQPTGIFAKNGGSVDKYAGLGYKLR